MTIGGYNTVHLFAENPGMTRPRPRHRNKPVKPRDRLERASRVGLAFLEAGLDPGVLRRHLECLERDDLAEQSPEAGEDDPDHGPEKP